MTVSSTANVASYACNGSLVAFSFSFPIFETSDLVVVLRDTVSGSEVTLTESVHYSVSAGNNDFTSGGTVTTVATYSSDYVLTIRRVLDFVQEADYEEGDAFPAAVHEAALDRQVMLMQQVDEKFNQTLRAPEVGSVVSALPNKVDRSLKYLAFDSDGNPIAGDDYTQYDGAQKVYVSSDYATLGTAVADIGTNKAILIMDSSLAVSSDVVIPETVSILWYRNGMWVEDVSTLYTVTMQGSFLNLPKWKIFDCSWTGSACNLKISGLSMFRPEWAGADPEGVIDSAESFGIIQFLNSSRKTILLQDGAIYEVDFAPIVDGSFFVSEGCTTFTSTTSGMYFVASGTIGIGFSGITFNCSGSYALTIYANSGQRINISKCVFLGDSTNQLVVGSLDGCTIHDCLFPVGIGISFGYNATHGGNSKSVVIEMCIFSGSVGISVDSATQNVSGLSISGCVFDMADGQGIVFGGGEVRGASISGCSFIATTGDCITDSAGGFSADNVSVLSCSFVTTGVGAMAFYIKACSGLIVNNNHFTQTGGPTYCIAIATLAGSGDNVISNNIISSTPSASIAPIVVGDSSSVFLADNLMLASADLYVGTLSTAAFNNRKIVAITADPVPERLETGATYTNSGASGNLDITLPASLVGLEFSCVQTHASHTLTFVASGADAIRGTAATSAQGGGVKLRCVVAGFWDQA